ncbi:hypothetical protein GWI33_000943 [Rhynchophorus ferrugineus]|uniref:Uncharacterized protein n=1 Tax=Rhynchophorus ferrugineus TaxID=354439 RepID=A0A834IQV1_RHYFE|nr:hypothetical protein GWI33_000943 [Rhynchophorus ferrugineus]
MFDRVLFFFQNLFVSKELGQAERAVVGKAPGVGEFPDRGNSQAQAGNGEIHDPLPTRSDRCVCVFHSFSVIFSPKCPVYTADNRL